MPNLAGFTGVSHAGVVRKMLCGPDRLSSFCFASLTPPASEGRLARALNRGTMASPFVRSTLGGSALCASLGTAIGVEWRAPVSGHPIPICTLASVHAGRAHAVP